MSLHIYTASAGAGKTHTLTREYLRLALSSPDPHYFTSIQAVTFTKKATGEMKERITKELYRLAQDPEGSPFLQDLQQELGLSTPQLQQRAFATLRTMLVDYDAFRIRTIDSFFQEILRAFAHELGHAGLLRVELNTQPHLNQAVLEVLSAQDEQGASTTIRRWIEQILAQAIREGRKFSSLERGLSEFATQLETEAVKLLRSKQQFPSKEAVHQLSLRARETSDAITASIQSQAQAILDLLDSQGIKDEHIYYKDKGPISPIRKLASNPSVLIDKKKLVTDSAHLRDYLMEDDLLEKFIAKSAPTEVVNRFLTIAAEVKELSRKLAQGVASQAALQETSLQILKYADRYGILIDIDSELQRLKQEGSIMFLSDAPSLISSLLKDSTHDTPFLYEKIGTRIGHHMIDEFQDTSRMQYTNFRPLLENSLAEGKDCLVVGDAKQSIYRFRNSDSSLLTHDLPRDFAEQSESHLLEQNWRSSKEVIAFNNALYSLLPELLLHLFDTMWEETHGVLEGMEQLRSSLLDFLADQLKAYADVHQLHPEQKEGAPAGQVVLHRYGGAASTSSTEEDEPSDEEDDGEAKGALAQLPQVLISLQQQGYKASDIAILVRWKKTASDVAIALQDYEGDIPEGCSLHFVSEEALSVGESYAVRFLIACLSYIADPHEGMRQKILEELYHQIQKAKDEDGEPASFTDKDFEELLLLGRRGLYEVVENLIHRFTPLLPEGESAYLIKLLDLLYRWEQDQSADIAAFLDYWEEQGALERIVSTPSEDAIQLMTVHKSKGLGFPVVLLPDLGWKFDPASTHENVLWCPIPDLPQLKPFTETGVSAVPLKYSSALGNSFFAVAYYEEYLRYRIDTLNLLYVATTRAKQELHLWLPELTGKAQKSGKKSAPKPADPLVRLDTLLLELLEDQPGALPWIDIPSSEADSYSSPLPAPSHSTESSEEVVPLQALQSYPLDTRLAILREGLDYFTQESQRRYGRTMHLILSRIERTEELEDAVSEAVRRGYITAEQTDELTTILLQILNDPATKRWFDGSGVVFNEQAIIGGGIQGSRRPDRLLFYPDGRVEVVDYKFGKHSSRYFTQVRRYMTLLKKMGYDQVLGYLCYLREGSLEVVPVA